jgi:hypothetical protein
MIAANTAAWPLPRPTALEARFQVGGQRPAVGAGDVGDGEPAVARIDHAGDRDADRLVTRPGQLADGGAEGTVVVDGRRQAADFDRRQVGANPRRGDFRAADVESDDHAFLSEIRGGGYHQNAAESDGRSSGGRPAGMRATT